MDLELEVVAKKGVARKALLLMFVNIAPRMHAGDGTPLLFFFHAKIRLHLYVRGSVRRAGGLCLSALRGEPLT
jgi:hypothetical protein